MFSLEFRGEVNHEETKVMGLSIFHWRPDDHSVESYWHSVSVWRTDGRTGGQTDLV